MTGGQVWSSATAKTEKGTQKEEREREVECRCGSSGMERTTSHK